MRSVVFFALVSLLAGCAEGTRRGEVEDHAADPVPADPASVSMTAPIDRAHAADGRSIGAAPSKPLQQTCRKDAFCDDFEDATPGTRWTSSLATEGTLDFVGPSSSLGMRSLRATTNGPGAVAYLTLAGPTLEHRWTGALGFSLRVDATPVTSLGGPQLIVIDANGAATRIGFSVHPAGIKLDQTFEACAGASCAARSDLVAEGSAEWRRLVVAIEMFETTTPPYGRIEVTVDGGDLIVLPLVVTPFAGTTEVHAGVTVADDAPATAHVDDVIFFTHD